MSENDADTKSMQELQELQQRYEDLCNQKVNGPTCFGETNRHKWAADAIIGLPFEKAKALFASRYPMFSLRVCWEDGHYLYGEKNIDWDRLSVGVVDGVIAKEWNRVGDTRGLNTWG